MKLEEAVETPPPRPGTPDRGAPDGASPFAGPLGIAFAVALAATLVAALVLRFVAKSPLWEDEALTVAIARRPLGQLHGLLRHDGSPPLYYVLLHVWMKVFGTGNRAARGLSGVFGVLSLPVAYLVGRRVAGADAVRRQWVGWATVIIVATSPYAFRYSTEVRMYELETLLVLVGYLAVANAWERPRAPWLVGVAAVTAALLYTQYWSLYLLAVVGVAFLYLGRREGARSPAWRILAAMAVGCLTFLPWVPTFLYQGRHTATPWAERINPLMASYRLLLGFAGQRGVAAYTLVMAFFALGAFGLFGAAVNRYRTELDWRTRPATRWAAYVFAGTVAIGLSLAYVGTGAAAIRYPSIVFGLFAVVVGYGVVAFGSRLPRYGALAIIVVCGLIGGYHNSTRARTQAKQIASAINAGAKAGDVVVYCPDQLGLDGWRLVRPGLKQYAFPTLASPEIVNWVDYESRNQVFHVPGVAGNLADPTTFAAEILRRAGTHTIWYVYSDGYRTFGTKCGDMAGDFARARPGSPRLVHEDLSVFESENLYRFSP